MPMYCIAYCSSYRFSNAAQAQAVLDQISDNSLLYDGIWTIYERYLTLELAQADKQILDARQSHRDYYFLIKPCPFPYEYMEREYSKEGFKPFETQGQNYHCAFLTEKCMISFYESPEKGEKDRRTEMKLGRYLRRFSHLDDNKISEIAARYGAMMGDSVLKFATTREEIKLVYMDGPNSCMAGDMNYDGFHPAEAYASPDLAVAYLDRDGDITARTLVNVVTKRYIRIYGDTARLRELLEKEGYCHSNFTLAGARLLKIYRDEDKTSVLLPYFDGCITKVHYNDDDEEYLIVENPPRILHGGAAGFYDLQR